MTLSVSPVIALDDDPRAATRFYAVAFNTDAKSNATELNIGGLDFRFVRAPARELTPAASFMVRFPAGQQERLRQLWAQLMGGDDTIGTGTALMPLTSYDFSPLFGWLEDGYGVSWQLMIAPTSGAAAGNGEDTAIRGARVKPSFSVIPYFMWTGDEPQAAAATEVYNEVFGAGNFMALDSPGIHKFTFGNGVAMHLCGSVASGSSTSAADEADRADLSEELRRARRALGLPDATPSHAAMGPEPTQTPQPDRFGVYWV